MPISPINQSMRLGGLASGLDTDQMVRSLMQVEQLKVDRIIQQRTRMEWEQNIRREINDQVAAFRHATMSVLSPQTNLNTARAFQSFQVSFSSPPAGVSVTTNPDARTGTYSLEVDQIAAGATAASSERVEGLILNQTLEALSDSIPFNFVDDQVSFQINGETFNIQKTATLRQLFDTVNRSEAGVRMDYSELTGQVSLTTRQTGSATSLQIEDLSGQALAALKLTESGQPAAFQGTDAVVRINGIEVTRSANLFTVDGINYRLVAKTAVPVTFTVEPNTDETVGRIRHFVEQYNELIKNLQDKFSETFYREFPPLTDTQRAQMSDRDIEIWEEKAQSGLMRNDRNLGSLINQMRTILFDSAAGSNLAAIGIMTGPYHERGQLHLNEETLRQALADDPDTVMQLFMQTSDDASAQTRYQESGILQRLRDAFTSFSSRNYQPSRYAQDMIDLNSRIQRMNQVLQEKEEAYWRQFSAMEQALASMYAQSSWLAQNLGQN